MSVDSPVEDPPQPLLKFHHARIRDRELGRAQHLVALILEEGLGALELLLEEPGLLLQACLLRLEVHLDALLDFLEDPLALFFAQRRCVRATASSTESLMRLLRLPM